MFEVRCDSDKQRLDIVADQALSAEEFQTIISAIKSHACKLSAGFVVAVDFRGMWVEDPFLNERFKLLQEALLDCGARKIGTLLDNPAVRLRLSQQGLKTRSNEITRRFYDPEEWEEFLSQP
jgi:hypothetical protein